MPFHINDATAFTRVQHKHLPRREIRVLARKLPPRLLRARVLRSRNNGRQHGSVSTDDGACRFGNRSLHDRGSTRRPLLMRVFGELGFLNDVNPALVRKRLDRFEAATPGRGYDGFRGVRG